MRDSRLAVVLGPVVVLGSLLSLISMGACGEKPAAPAPEAENAPAKQEEAKPEPAAEEIKIGQTMPYSGPASAYATIGRVEGAYFKKINEEGGINGKKLNLISLDDGYSPPKTVEQTRKLVEQEQVVFVFNSVGTAANSAVQKYLNTKQVPQLFVATGATKWGDPANFPWTIGFNPTYQLEGKTYAEHILATKPKAKIAVLYQNDDYGKDLLQGLKDGLGDKAKKMIISEATYEISDPTIDSQIVSLRGSKADTFVNITTPKFAAQAIRKVHDIGWKPTHYLNQVGASIATVLKPAGVENAVGALTVGYFKDATDPQYDNDPEMQRFKAFMKKYYPDGDPNDGSNTYGYIAAQVAVQVLKQCGSDVSSKNVMAQATSLKDFVPELVLPGLSLGTSAKDFFPFDKLQMVRFNGQNWKVLDETSAQANAKEPEKTH
jgi:branched-chain amino acid transport system substrate-binding protein